jgi:hypothetical protein
MGQLGDGEGEGVPFLQPSLWDGWIYGVIGLLVAGGVVAVLAHRADRWTAALVAANVGVNGALLALIAWLAADDRIVNPRFMEVLAAQAEWDRVPDVNPWLIVLLVGLVLVWDSVDTVVSARRSVSRAGDMTGRVDAGEALRADG